MLRIIQFIIAKLGAKPPSASSNKFWGTRNREMDEEDFCLLLPINIIVL